MLIAWTVKIVCLAVKFSVIIFIMQCHVRAQCNKDQYAFMATAHSLIVLGCDTNRYGNNYSTTKV